MGKEIEKYVDKKKALNRCQSAPGISSFFCFQSINAKKINTPQNTICEKKREKKSVVMHGRYRAL